MNSLDYFEGSYNEYLIRKADQERIPMSGTFELLPACNMRCKMCYIQQDYASVLKHGGLKSVDFWYDKFKEAADEGLLYPLITGGEPLLYPGFFELYERIQPLGFHLCLNTNATLLDREKVERLAKMPPRRINISLYGASEETYERLCGYRDGFNKVIEAFELLNEYNIQFRVHCTLTPDNYDDYQGIIDICNKYHAPLQMTTYMFPPFRKEKGLINNEGRFTPEMAAEASMRYKRDHYASQTQLYKNSVYAYVKAFETPQIYSLYNDNTVACHAGKATFWVDWHGYVSGCGVHNIHKFNLEEVSFKEAWKQITAITDQTRLPEKCKTCNYRCVCMICPAAAYTETGSENEAPEYLCRYAKHYAKLVQKEYERLYQDESNNL